MSRSILVIAALATLLVGACGGSSTGDPSGVAREALSIVASKDLDKLADLACAAQRDKVREQFDVAGALAGALPGVDADAFFDAVAIDTSGVTVGEATIEGDTAEVPLSGSMRLDLDTEKLRPIVKQLLEQQGVPATDELIDVALSQIEQLGQEIPMDEPMTLVKEDGAWKICEP